MGPPESPTGHPENQEGRRKRLARQPRTRCCLLKGCERRFHPRQARQRYCSERRGGRRNSDTGRRRRSQQKRNGQGRRYRDRVKNRKPAEPEAVNDAARVITTEHFFDHCCDRPSCYEGFVWARRSPLQRFCSHACRHALERVRERERRWKQARDLIRRY